ncbi:MAG: DoxX family protein [Devosia sp.]
MPTDLSSTLYAIARLLLGGAFVVFAIRHVFHNIPRLTGIIEGKVPMARQVVLFGIALQFVGGLLSAIGPWQAAGGLLMIVFLVLATVLFHPMWKYAGAERAPHTVATLMNTALCGAFLLLVAGGV